MSWHTCVRVATLAVCVWLVAGQQEERKPPNIIAPTPLESAAIKYIPKTPVGGVPWGITCQAEAGQISPSYKWLKIDGENMIDVGMREGNHFTVDADTGRMDLVYPQGRYVPTKHDGKYICMAEVTFKDNNKAASFSPPIHIEMLELYIPKDPNLPVQQNTVRQYEYKYFECELPEGTILNTDDVTFSWFIGSENKQITDFDNGRIYVDTEGGLHFIYVKTSDETSSQDNYKCGVGSNKINVIQLGIAKNLVVEPRPPGAGAEPRLQFDNSNTEQMIYQDATLECIFSGYDPKNAAIPDVTWQDKKGNEISNNNKFKISDDTRRLTIMDVQAEDEGDYYCKGSNSLSSGQEATVTLNVVSAPIFQNKGPQDITLTEGEDAVFECDARSLQGEPVADKPVWYINGAKQGSWLNDQKYKFSPDNKILTITGVKKSGDVGCFQCMVRNNHGDLWGDACLSVVLPIDIRRFPNPYQEIDKGDMIDLSYTYTHDAQSGPVTETWYFNNESYVSPDLPPHFVPHTDGADSKVIQLNTSSISDEDYSKIGGIYKLRLSNKDTSQEFKVEVVARLEPEGPVAVVQSAGFPMWIIGVILGLLVLILVIVIIVCCVCKRQQEGDYNVDKKEVGAGLDPKKELMEKGFDDYSRPNYDDYEDVPRQGQPYVPYDDVDAPLTGADNKSLGEYSEEDEARLGFNEDGSFIGQYYPKKDPSGPPPPNYENHASIA